jgi:hypothetical protein
VERSEVFVNGMKNMYIVLVGTPERKKLFTIPMTDLEVNVVEF